MYCPNCGSKCPDRARFCPNCGFSFHEDPLPPQQSSSRPVWPWIALSLVALAAAVLLILHFFGPGVGAAQPALPSPTGAEASGLTPAVSPEAVVSSPTPTTQIVVVTASPAPVTVPPVTVAPVTPVPPTPQPKPDAVKVFYFEQEKVEFTEAVGESVKLHAVAYPTDQFYAASFTWSVSDPAVLQLTVSADTRECEVRCLKHQTGGAMLSVSCQGVTRQVKVYTKPPATPVPQPGAEIKLEGEKLYRINIFLSNFSEQFSQSFNASTAADDYLLRLVELYCKINHHDRITYIDGDECISLADMNLYFNRFFGRTVNPNEGATYMLTSTVSFRYTGGYFHFPAADGEAYNRFTVVHEMKQNSDGTYTVQFQNFDLDLNEYWGKGMTNDLYWLNNDQVANLVWSGRAKPVQGGTAVVRDYTFNGSTTYQILSYEVWNISF